MKQKLFAFFAAAMLLLGMSACTNDDNPAAPEAEVTLEDALNDGTIVVLTFNLNGEDFYVAFMRVGDTYELLGFDKALTRADEPALTEKDCDFSMVHDKDNNLIKFTVKEKKTSDLVLTAIIDIKESTMEVIWCEDEGFQRRDYQSAEGERRRRYLGRRTGERCQGGGGLLLGWKQGTNPLHFHQRRWNILLQDHW